MEEELGGVVKPIKPQRLRRRYKGKAERHKWQREYLESLAKKITFNIDSGNKCEPNPVTGEVPATDFKGLHRCWSISSTYILSRITLSWQQLALLLREEIHPSQRLMYQLDIAKTVSSDSTFPLNTWPCSECFARLSTKLLQVPRPLFLMVPNMPLTSMR
jgi:hypothetical protein